MKNYAPDPDDLTIGRGSAIIPSSMEQDINADEEVINQQVDDTYPRPVDNPTPVDDLSNSIAYALDGSGPGPTGFEPQDVPRKVITEGITGANLQEEEDAANEWRSL